MSFEFNLNENLDRSEDDNEPQDDDRLGGERGPFVRGVRVPGIPQVVGARNHQDNVSLGGDGGLFDRVPGVSQVGAANRSQGQARDGPDQDRGLPFGDQGLPFERQGRGLARGGLGTEECQTSRGPIRHVGTYTVPCVWHCFCSIHLCGSHKQILWDSKVPRD